MPKVILFPMTGGKYGGSHICLLEIILNLDPSKYQPLIGIDHEGEFAHLLKQKQIDYHVFPIDIYIEGRHGLFGNLKALFRIFNPLKRFLRQHKVDLIHAIDDPMPATFALIAKCLNIPLIFHHANRVYASRLNKLTCQLSYHHIAISQFIKRQLAFIDPKKIDLIYNPIFSVVKTDAVAPLSDRKLIGYFSNIIPQKRVDTFIELANILINRYQLPCQFLVMGDDRDGILADKLTLIEQYGLKDYFTIKTFDPNVQSIIQSCDVIVCPAENEGFGRVLTEAMQLGVPVVASAHAGHLEIIQHEKTGFLCNKDQPEAFAEAIQRLLGDESLYQSIVQQALEDVQTRFSVQKHIEGVEVVYQKCLS